MNKPCLLLAAWLALPFAALAVPAQVEVALPVPAPAPSTGAPPALPKTPGVLDPAQLRELRSRYAAWQALGEPERARVRAAAARIAALPPAQQQALREQFAQMDQRYRDGWLLGPQLGQQFPKLQGLFGYVPAAQRAAALAVLRQLGPEQLTQLSLVAQRTPPQDRDRVRAEFLAVAPGARDAWLKQNVGH
jgi:hypothetical protein